MARTSPLRTATGSPSTKAIKTRGNITPHSAKIKRARTFRSSTLSRRPKGDVRRRSSGLDDLRHVVDLRRVVSVTCYLFLLPAPSPYIYSLFYFIDQSNTWVRLTHVYSREFMLLGLVSLLRSLRNLLCEGSKVILISDLASKQDGRSC